MATTTYTVSRDIQAPPQVVWDLLTDPSSYRDWNPAVLSIVGTMAPGSTITPPQAVSWAPMSAANSQLVD